MKRLKRLTMIFVAALLATLVAATLFACDKKQAEPQYTLTLMGGDTALAQVKKTSGATVAPNDQTAQEYVDDAALDFYILGWSAVEGGEAIELPTTMPSSDLTLYAIQGARVIVNVYLQPADLSTDKQKYVFSEEYSFEDVAAKGATYNVALEIDKFVLRTDGGDESSLRNVALNNKDNSVSLYFDRTDYLTVRYYANLQGATGSMANDKMPKEGGEYVVKANGFESYGYRFVGWCENRNGNGTVYAPGDTMNITRDTSLYAIWDRGYIDLRTGSDDVIFTPKRESGSAILSRRGVGEVRGSVDGVIATFRDEKGAEYTAKLYSNNTFSWKGEARHAELFDAVKNELIAGSYIDTDDYGEATLYLTADANVEAMLINADYEVSYRKLAAGTHRGNFYYSDADYDYAFRLSDGYEAHLVFGTAAEGGEAIFVTRGVEYGAYAEGVDENFELTGDLLLLDGYGGAYREDATLHLDWYGTYAYLDDEGSVALVLEDDYDLFYSEAIIKISRQVDNLTTSYIPLRFYEYGNLLEYGSVTNADGSEVFTDGFGNIRVKASDGKITTGNYEYIEEGLVAMTNASGTRYFRYLIDGGFEEVSSYEKAALIDPGTFELTGSADYLYTYPNGGADIYTLAVHPVFGYDVSMIAESGVYSKLSGNNYRYVATNGAGFEYRSSSKYTEMIEERAVEIVRRVLVGEFTSDDGGVLTVNVGGTATYSPLGGDEVSGSYTFDGEALRISAASKTYLFNVDVDGKKFEYVANPSVRYYTIDALEMADVGEIELFDDGTAILYVFRDLEDGNFEAEQVATGRYSLVDDEKGIYAFTCENSEFNVQFVYDNELFGMTTVILKSSELVDGTFVGDGNLELTAFGYATFVDADEVVHEGLYTVVETDFTTKKAYKFECLEKHDVECDLSFYFTLGDGVYEEFDPTGGMPDGFHFVQGGVEYILVLKTVSAKTAPIYTRVGNSFVNVATVSMQTLDPDLFIYRITVSSVAEGYEDVVKFESVDFAFGGPNEIYVRDSRWADLFDVSNGGMLKMDGFGHGAFYNGVVSFEGNYVIDEAAGVITLTTEEERVYYFDFSTSGGNLTISKRGDEYGTYYFYNVKESGVDAPIIVLDGYGGLGVLRNFEDTTYFCEGEYTLGNGVVEAFVLVNGERIDFKFETLSLTLENREVVNGYVAYTGEKTVVVNGYTAYILDGYFNAVYINEYGVAERGTYYIDGDSLYFVDSDGNATQIEM